MKANNPGCSCCECTAPPPCTLTGSGGGTPGGDVTLTWTTDGADTVTIIDSDGTTISTDKNGVEIITGGACKVYTLAATNDCGTSYCIYGNSCPAGNCSYCEYRTYPTSFTVQITNSGALAACGCSGGENASVCADYNGSFTVTGAASCRWEGGPFGSSRCLKPPLFTAQYAPFTIRLEVSAGDFDGSDSGSLYAKITFIMSVVDPPPCSPAARWRKKLSSSLDRIDCEDLIPGGTYVQDTTGVTKMCDLALVVI